MHDEYLFVYGTLRSEMKNPVREQIQEDIELIGRAYIHGELFDFGSYPGAVTVSEDGKQVVGELLKLIQPAKVLSALDTYEGYTDANSEYVRKKGVVIIGNKQVEAWIYVYNRPVEGKLKIEGDYLNYLKKKQKEYGTSSNED